MNDDEKRALNEKLARWLWPDAVIRFYQTLSGELARVYAEPVDVDGVTRAALLFTNSLDAQAQWLWPKLARFSLSLSHYASSPHYACTIRVVDGAYGEADDPALASAIAIGGWIDAYE